MLETGKENVRMPEQKDGVYSSRTILCIILFKGTIRTLLHLERHLKYMLPLYSIPAL